MKITVKDFYYISCSHDMLALNANTFGKACPILWNNKGLFCIISRQKVQNVLDLIKDQQNLPVLNKKEVGLFHWEDGEHIDARIAGMLLS